MNFVKKVRNIIPRSLYIKSLSLIVFTIIGIFFELLGIGLVLPIITIVTTGNFHFDFGPGINKILNNFLSSLNETELFIVPLLILLFVYTLKGVYLLFLRFYNGKFSYEFVTKLSNDIYKNYLYQDQLFHLKRNSADLIRIISNEVIFFLKNVIMPYLTIFMEILVVIGIILLLLFVETKSTLFVLVIILFFSVIYYLIISKKIKKWGQERIFHEGKKLQNLTQGLHGIKTIKIFNQEQNFLDKFNYNLSSSAKVNQYSTLVSQIPSILIEFIAIFLIVSFMIYNVQSSLNVTEYFPKLALFAAAAFRIMPSISRLIVNFQALRYSVSGVDKLHKEFPLKSELSYMSSPEIEINFNREVNISNLSFKYPDNNANILQDINLKIRTGESIGITGKTGEGKSTFIDLICGLLQPQEGKILVDNNNIQKNIKSWQQKIGYVPQNIYLLDDTIKENIIFGKKIDKETDKNLANSIKLAQLDKLISKLPEGLNTLVGDRGTRLSGGQIQRIGVARAIMNNAQVLIFDEATSALDIETERDLINDIYKLKSKKTLIIISHRLSILEHCDRIYNLKDKSFFLKQ